METTNPVRKTLNHPGASLHRRRPRGHGVRAARVECGSVATPGQPSVDLANVLDALFGPAGQSEGWTRPVYRALRAGAYVEAVARCSDELSVHPAVGLAFFLRGAAQLAQEHYGLAVADLTRAIALDPCYAALTESLAGR